jgi:hypothetical protein
MPVFPWRFIDSLLGRSRPGDEEPATDEDVAAEVARLYPRLEADVASVGHLDETGKAALRAWAVGMLRLRVPAADGRSKRDMHLQLGAVSGAIRAVIEAIDGASAEAEAGASKRLSWRLRSIESEIASPLYTVDEQASVRVRLDHLLDQLDDVEQGVDLTMLVPRLVDSLTPTVS